jgi:hypothetical protein
VFGNLRKFFTKFVVTCMEKGRGLYRVVMGKPGEKKPLGRPRRRWEDNSKSGSSGSGMWGYGLD